MKNQTKLSQVENNLADKAYNRLIERYLKANRYFEKQYSKRFCLRMKLTDGLCTMVLGCDGKNACLTSIEVPADEVALMINRYDWIVYNQLQALSLNKLRNTVCGWLEESGCDYKCGKPYLTWPACQEFLEKYISEDSYENEV